MITNHLWNLGHILSPEDDDTPVFGDTKLLGETIKQISYSGTLPDDAARIGLAAEFVQSLKDELYDFTAKLENRAAEVCRLIGKRIEFLPAKSSMKKYERMKDVNEIDRYGIKNGNFRIVSSRCVDRDGDTRFSIYENHVLPFPLSFLVSLSDDDAEKFVRGLEAKNEYASLGGGRTSGTDRRGI